MRRFPRRATALAVLLLAWGGPAASEPPEAPPSEGPPILEEAPPPDGPPPRHGRPHPHGPPRPEAMIARYADRLELDEEALASIRAISLETLESSEQGRAELEAAHEGMRALLSEEVPDEAKVMEQAERIGALETEGRQQRLRAMLAIRALLSDEQRAELIRMREESRSAGHRKPDGPLGPCAPDLEDLCPESRAGRSALRCLAGRWNDVSRRCREFVQRGPPPR